MKNDFDVIIRRAVAADARSVERLLRAVFAPYEANYTPEA
jgi:hypothetical protein